MTDHRTYTQADLAAANEGIPHGLSPLDVDRLWAERRTSEEWARLPEETHLDFLARINQKEIQAELGVLRRRRKTGTRHEP